MQKERSSNSLARPPTSTTRSVPKRRSAKVRRKPGNFSTLSPLHITELGPDGARLYTNRASLDYYGITLEEWQDADLRQVLHPQDAEVRDQ